jgi:hypothetical protein
MMKNLIKKKKGEKSKVTFIKKMVTRENSNWMELFQGPSGQGKTWSAISQCYAIDPSFDVSKQLVFDFPSLMSLINSDGFKKLKWKQIIFDEPQTSISNKNWQSLTNKMMAYLVTTFRHQNVILIFCCPYRDFLDSASMKMIHCITEMHSIDRKKKKVKTRPKLQQYNSKLKKTYEHSIYVLTEDKRIRPLFFDYVPQPPKELIDTYEEMKTQFTSKLNKEIEAQLVKITEKSQDKPYVNSPYQRRIVELVDACEVSSREELDIVLKQEGFYSDHSKISRSIQALHKKGVPVEL